MISSRIISILFIFGSIFKIRTANELCDSQVKYFHDELRVGTFWAKKVRDSWGNLPITGTYSGNKFDFGQFDQCVNFRQNSKAYGSFIGKYCIIFVTSSDQEILQRTDNESIFKIEPKIFPPTRSLDKDLGFGVCLPDSCTANDIRDIIDLELKSTKGLSVSSTYDQELFCSTTLQRRPELNKLQTSAM